MKHLDQQDAEEDRRLLIYAAKLMLYFTVMAGLFFFGLHQLFNYLKL